MEELTIILVEDDLYACNAFARLAEDMDDITILSITNNADEALKQIQDYLPNVLILDLELHFGKGDGLTLLNQLRTINLDIIPYILITTNNSSSTTYTYARELGADYIMYKHQDDYSEENVLAFLRMMKESIKSKISSQNPSGKIPESPELHTKRLTRRIIAELNLVGISPKAIGYKYLIDSILIVMKGPTQNLCTIIGQKYGKSESSVERAMYNAINKAWKQTEIDELLKHYTAKVHSNRGTPTITEFIYYYANKLKNEY